MPYLSSRLPCCLLIGASLLALSACAGSGEIPGQPKTAVETAARLKEEGDYRAAAALYSEMLQRKPDSAPAAIALAAMQRKMGQPEQALMLMRRMEIQYPSDPDIMTQIGYAQVDLGQTQEAVRTFDRLMALKHHNAAAYNGKGVAFDSAGNHVAAQHLYEHALKLDPNAVNIKNNLAMSKILTGHPQEAIALLEPLHAAEPDNSIIRHNLAMAYGMAGRDSRSLELNMVDLTREQAEENLKFYKDYASKQTPYKRPLIASSYKDVPMLESKAPDSKPAPARVASRVEPEKHITPPAPVEPKVVEDMPMEKPVAYRHERIAPSKGKPIVKRAYDMPEPETEAPVAEAEATPKPEAEPAPKLAATQLNTRPAEEPKTARAKDWQVVEPETEESKEAAAEGPQDVSPSSGSKVERTTRIETIPFRRHKSDFPTKHGEWSRDMFLEE